MKSNVEKKWLSNDLLIQIQKKIQMEIQNRWNNL